MNGAMTRRTLLQSTITAALSSSAAPLVAKDLLVQRNKEIPLRSTSFSPEPRLNSSNDLCYMSATHMASLLRKRKLSAREVMQAHLHQIARVNSKVNAIVTLVPEDRLMAQALAADESIAKGKWLGPLHGLPIGVKDLHEAKGLRTTYGSPLTKDFVPDFDCLVVEREKSAGGIVIGKTNVPELGLGSQTTNPVFGATLNPYDVTKTCGGSTGGGSVALACGMVALADGSDFGGSLRNPPNFCNIVGMRPSPGRVPDAPSRMGWFTLSVAGPVARNVTDCAYLLSVLAGFDRRSPISIDQPGRQFSQALAGRNFKGVRVAMFKDMGLPWEAEVRNTVLAQRKVFESLGCIVEDAEPDFTDADECLLTWRHWYYEQAYGDLLEANADKFNSYVHWHVQEGRKLTGPQLSRTEAKRTALYERMRQFMEKYEFFIAPVNQVLPFDVHSMYPSEIAGVKMENYLSWMKSAYYISVVGNPAISVPCGFSSTGLPIGIQIVGRHHDDWGVLQVAYAFEQATEVGRRRPSIV